MKRLAASFVLACRSDGFSEDCARDSVLSCVRSYRERMAEYSEMRIMDVWYASIDVEKLIPTIQDSEASERVQKRLQKARERNVLEYEFPELVTSAGLTTLIKDNLPLIYHPRDQGHEEQTANLKGSSHNIGKRCRKTGVCFWTVLRSWTQQSRSWVSAAWELSAASCF